MDHKIECTIIVPCYNEAERLQPERFVTFARANPHIRFLFVNDGSVDATPLLLQTLNRSNPTSFTWLDLECNGGKAAAVRAGILGSMTDARVRFVGFWDADLATPLETIPLLLEQIAKTPTLQMIFGARVRLLGHAIQRRPMRHYLGRCFATVASMVLKLPIYDTQCGAKIFRVTPDLRQIFAKTFLTSWVFDVEILARFVALRHGHSDDLCNAIFEYPLHEWKDVAGSRVKPTDFIKAFGELLRIYYVYLRRPSAHIK
jgi:glycosyltransferase involved in cell wall biosynthesis